LHDPMVISFDSVPVCESDRWTDMPPVPISHSSVAQHDKIQMSYSF